MNPQRKDQMHPEDLRNLFIFCIFSILLYFAYDVFVQRPQIEALNKAREAQAEKVLANAPAAQGEEIKIRPRTEILRESPRIKIDNGKIKGSIALAGGRIDDIALEEYFETLEKKDNVVIISPRGTEHPRTIEYGWVSDDKAVVLPGPDTRWQAEGNTKLDQNHPVTITWNNGQGLSFARTFAIDDNYMMTVTQKVTNNSGRTVTLHPYGLVSQIGQPPVLRSTWILHEGPIGYVGEDLHEITYKALHKKPAQSFQANQGWTGITDKYWLTALIPPQGAPVSYSYRYSGTSPAKGQKDTGRYQVDFTGSAMDISNGSTAESESRLFAGAKKVLILEKYERDFNIPQFNLAVNFGWFWFFAKPFFYALHYMSLYIGNLGVAIIFLTIMVRSAVFPLTNASYKSFAKMKKANPQVLALRKQYGDDKKKLQEELVKLYQREGVNPMAGCLPMLMQIPIFFALYKVLYVTIEMRHAAFFGWIKDLSASDPTTIFNLFGLIDWTPPAFLHVGVWPCLMLLAMLVQKKLNPPPQDPIQRDMANYFPFVIAYVMSKFPAGLVIYWTFSAVIGIIQQVIIMRSLGVPIYIFGQSEEEKELEEAIAHGPGVHPLVEMAEEDVEHTMFDDSDGGPQKPISPPKPKKKKKK